MIVSLLSALLVTWALWPEIGFSPLTPVAVGPRVVEVPAETVPDLPARRESVDVETGELVEAQAVIYTIAVRVVDKDGAPRPGESVMLRYHDMVRYAQTDAKGLAEFEVVELNYQVGVVGRFVSYDRNVVPVGRSLRRQHELVIKPGLHLDVRVEDVNGRPIAGRGRVLF